MEVTQITKIYKIIVETIKNEDGILDHKNILPETDLFGGKSDLDSLGLVALIIALEQNIEDKIGVSLTIADEKAMSLKNSPFRTVQSLEKFLIDKLQNNE